MKYSSASSFGVREGMGGTRLLVRAHHLETPQEHVPVHLVYVERAPDRVQQHDRQAAAEVFLELDEPAEHVARIAVLLEMLRQLGRVDRESERKNHVHHATPVSFRQ